MSARVTKVFAFACENPDYWELLLAPNEAPEVTGLEERRRAAFNAAAAEVRRLAAVLLDAAHAKLKEKAQGSSMSTALSKAPSSPSYGKAAFNFERVFSGRGRGTSLKLALSQGNNSRINVWVGLYTAANRRDMLVSAFDHIKDRVQQDGHYVYVVESITEGDVCDDIAGRLVNAFWPGVIAFEKVLNAS